MSIQLSAPRAPRRLSARQRRRWRKLRPLLWGGFSALQLDLRSLAAARLTLGGLTLSFLIQSLSLFEPEVYVRFLPAEVLVVMGPTLTASVAVLIFSMLALGTVGLALGALTARWSALIAGGLALLSITHPWLREGALGQLILAHGLIACTSASERASLIGLHRSLQSRPVEGDYSLTQRAFRPQQMLPQLATAGLFILGFGPLLEEGMTPLAIFLPLSPFFTPLCRALSAAILISNGLILTATHTATMSAFFFAPLCAGAIFWRLSARIASLFTGAPIRIYYDPDAPLSHAIARRISRLDVLRRCLWLARGGAPWAPQGLSGEALVFAQRRSLLVYEPQRRRAWLGPTAVLRLCRAIPALWPLLLLLVPLSPFWWPLYTIYARHRRKVPGEVAPYDPFPESNVEAERDGRYRTQLLKIMSLTHVPKGEELMVPPARLARLVELPLIALTCLSLLTSLTDELHEVSAPLPALRVTLEQSFASLDLLSLGADVKQELPSLPDDWWLIALSEAGALQHGAENRPTGLRHFSEARWRALLQRSIAEARRRDGRSVTLARLARLAQLRALQLWGQERLLYPAGQIAEGSAEGYH
ncbi:MAG: hypothetical protein VYD19_03220 [Myxococcota bacterium]|nr:hypothetical protein [Myxococcota bacterium]